MVRYDLAFPSSVDPSPPLNVAALAAGLWGHASATSARCCRSSSRRRKWLPKTRGCDAQQLRFGKTACFAQHCHASTRVSVRVSRRHDARTPRPRLPKSPNLGPCAAELIRADVQDAPALSGHLCACCQASENPQAGEPAPPAPAQPEFWWEKRPWPGKSSTLALPPLPFPRSRNPWQRGRAAGKGSNVLSQSSCSRQGWSPEGQNLGTGSCTREQLLRSGAVGRHCQAIPTLVGNAFVMLSAAPCLTLRPPAWACPAAALPLPPPSSAAQSSAGGFGGDDVSPGNGGLATRRETALVQTTAPPPPPESVTEW